MSEKNINNNGYPVKMEQPKTLFWARFWWFFGGILGAHHFYLDRYDHGLVYLLTFGGLGIGWARDLLRLQTYVLDANEDHAYIEWYKFEIRRFPKPPFTSSRFFGAVFFSYLLGQLWYIAIPEEEIYGYNLKLLIYLIPLIIAWGVWFVGNIGRECGSFWWTLLVSYMLYPTVFYFGDTSLWISFVSGTTAYIFDTLLKRWRLCRRRKLPLKKTIALVLIVSAIYYGSWTSYFYHNGADSDGEGIKISDLKQLLDRSMWLEVWAGVREHSKQLYEQGFWTYCRQLADVSETKGELHAYSILGLSQTCSQSELTARWRALSKEHHPDKVKGGGEEKRKAELYFMKIQEAYDILSKVKNRRQRRNRKSAA